MLKNLFHAISSLSIQLPRHQLSVWLGGDQGPLGGTMPLRALSFRYRRTPLEGLGGKQTGQKIGKRILLLFRLSYVFYTVFQCIFKCILFNITKCFFPIDEKKPPAPIKVIVSFFSVNIRAKVLKMRYSSKFWMIFPMVPMFFWYDNGFRGEPTAKSKSENVFFGSVPIDTDGPPRKCAKLLTPLIMMVEL